MTSLKTKRKQLGSKDEDLAESNDSVWIQLRKGPLKVAIIGSGNWGSTIARIVGHNVKRSYIFQDDVQQYVFEEKIGNEKLTDIINKKHENVKYLPGIKLPTNVKANPSLVESVKGAHLLVFVTPHQFIPSICRQLEGHVVPGAKAISLVKGFELDNSQIVLVSEYITQHLGLETCVLSGANVALDIALEQFAESTIGFDNVESAKVWQQLFDTPYFKVSCVRDTAGVELCGALKNIVALAAGFCDGLGLGSNTKAAIIRIGLMEMKLLADTFYHGISDATFWDSCGMADLITTCFGGRNRKCAEYFVKHKESWEVIEAKLLNGQKLQGTLTAHEVNEFLKAENRTSDYPLFTTVYRIAFENLDPSAIITEFMQDTPRKIPSHL